MTHHLPFSVAPSPTSAIHYSATKCINRHRSRGWLMPWGSNRCHQVKSFDEPLAKTLDANDIVFAVHVPLPNMEMSPWFQYVLAVLQFDIAFKMINQIGKMRILRSGLKIVCGRCVRKLDYFSVCVEDDVIITIDAGIAYRDNGMSEWTTQFHSVERRPLRCTLGVPKVNRHGYGQ